MDESTLEESFTSPIKKQPFKRKWLIAFKQRQNIRFNQLLQQAPGIYRSLGKEIKAIDFPYSSPTFRITATPPTAILLNGIQTGAAFYNRIGSKVAMKSIHIRGFIDHAGTTTVDNSGIRILIVYDRQTNGAAPTWNDVIQSRDQAGATTNTMYSGVNLDNRDRFVVLRDMTYETPYQQWDTNALVATDFKDEGKFSVNEFIKLKGAVTHYKSSSNPTTAADINTGGIFMFLASSYVDNTWAFRWQARVRYEDN
jgi:hypothetical protein